MNKVGTKCNKVVQNGTNWNKMEQSMEQSMEKRGGTARNMRRMEW